MKAGPPAVGRLHQFAHQDVGVNLGVAGPGGPVTVGGTDHVRCWKEGSAAGAAARKSRVPFEVAECLVDGGLVGGDDLRANPIVTERPQQRH